MDTVVGIKIVIPKGCPLLVTMKNIWDLPNGLEHERKREEIMMCPFCSAADKISCRIRNTYV